jgi:hypothetical protein
MNEKQMLAGLTLILIGMGLCFVASKFANRHWVKNNPTSHDFTWGYFLVFVSTLTWLSLTIALMDHLHDFSDLIVFSVASLLGLLLGLLGFLRVGWALVILTLCSINIFFWVIYFVYFRNRRHEFLTESEQARSGFRSLDNLQRKQVFWFVICALITPALYHFMVDGYHYEGMEILLAMVLPYSLLAFTLWIYKRYVL